MQFGFAIFILCMIAVITLGHYLAKASLYLWKESDNAIVSILLFPLSNSTASYGIGNIESTKWMPFLNKDVHEALHGDGYDIYLARYEIYTIIFLPIRVVYLISMIMILIGITLVDIFVDWIAARVIEYKQFQKAPTETPGV